MGRMEPTHLLVGQITRPHGIKGEVIVRTMTDHPEGIFSPGVVLYPAGTDPSKPSDSLPPLRVERGRPHRHGFVVKFAGVPDRNDAEGLRDLQLLASVEDLAPLEEGEVFFHDLMGLEVHTTDGRRVGTVREIYEVPPLQLLEVATQTGRVLLPFVDEVVTEVDVEGGRITIDPPDGLLELGAG